MDSLKISTYNCRSFTKNVHHVESLIDILCLQETLIDDGNFHCLVQFSESFCFSYTPSVRKQNCFVGRSSGGLAIYWRKLRHIKIETFSISSRVMGIKIIGRDFVYALLNVYCPCDYGTIDSLIEYRSTMADISNFCAGHDYDDILIVGDMNCDPSKGRFFPELRSMVNSFSLFVICVSLLQNK